MKEIQFILEDRYQYPIMYMYKKIRKALQPFTGEEQYHIQYCSAAGIRTAIEVDKDKKIIYLPEKKMSVLWCLAYAYTAMKEEQGMLEKQMVHSMACLAKAIRENANAAWTEDYCDPGTIVGIENPALTEKMKQITEETNREFLLFIAYLLSEPMRGEKTEETYLVKKLLPYMNDEAEIKISGTVNETAECYKA